MGQRLMQTETYSNEYERYVHISGDNCSHFPFHENSTVV